MGFNKRQIAVIATTEYILLLATSWIGSRIAGYILLGSIYFRFKEVIQAKALVDALLALEFARLMAMGLSVMGIYFVYLHVVRVTKPTDFYRSKT